MYDTDGQLAAARTPRARPRRDRQTAVLTVDGRHNVWAEDIPSFYGGLKGRRLTDFKPHPVFS